MVDWTPKKEFRGFHAGKPHFRAARTRCAVACRKYNSLPEDATPEQRAAAWREITASNRLMTKALTVTPATGPGTLSMTSSVSVVTPPTTPKRATSDGPLDPVGSHQPCDSSSRAPMTPSRSPHAANDAENGLPFVATASSISSQESPITADSGCPPSSFEVPSTEPAGTDLAHINLYPGYGTTPYIKPPLYVDYGVNVHIGGTTFINRNCTILDTPISAVRVGERCLFGPNVSFYGVSHPLDPAKRQDPTYPESSAGADIIIGDDCWVGGNVTILAGVSIGNACVVGAGSVVTKSIPPNCVAYGCPARVRKHLDAADPGRPRPDDSSLADGRDGSIHVPPRGCGRQEHVVNGVVLADVVTDGSADDAREPGPAVRFRRAAAAAAGQPPPSGPSRAEILLAIVTLLLAVAVMQLGMLLARV